MKCALASLGFINEDIQHNKNVIIDAMIRCAADADIILFGEAFLQGFYGATFDPTHDAKLALSADAAVIQEIRTAAKQHGIAVSFGFIEKDGPLFYSSQITIGSDGTVIDLYRRISPGWKERFAGEQYREGHDFHTFSLMGRSVAVGLCGDLWYDENILAMNQLHPDIVLWPVYTDFNFDEWNAAMKHEYATQAGRISSKVLYVNSVCKDKAGDDIARGGSAMFENGSIVQELPAGLEGILIVEV